jgi:hypothetical protein
VSGRIHCALSLSARVDRYARVSVRQCRYSVPARLIGRQVRVRLSASQVEIYHGSAVVATHPRLVARGAEHLVLDHYLEVLAGKPGAFAGSVSLAQARADGSFTVAHERFWAAARNRHGDTDGTRALIEVLLLHRNLSAGQVRAGINAALAAGSTSPDVVAIEARKARPGTGSPFPDSVVELPRPRRSAAKVVTLAARRAAKQPPSDAELLFQVFTEREEKASIAVASNAAFSEWARTFTDPRLCAAIVDRLTFDAHIETGTESYRLKTTRKRREKTTATA